jgi:CheY-like chemotaxis protein
MELDDDPLILRAVRDVLEGDGHSVVGESRGQPGIDAFRAALAGGEGFALVISDLGMPHVDGRQVASFVKDASPSTPVVLLTGWGRRLMAKGEVPAQVDRVVSKPPTLRQLREAVAYLLFAWRRGGSIVTSGVERRRPSDDRPVASRARAVGLNISGAFVHDLRGP